MNDGTGPDGSQGNPLAGGSPSDYPATQQYPVQQFPPQPYPAPPYPVRPRPGNTGVIIAGVLVVALIVAGGAAAAGFFVWKHRPGAPAASAPPSSSSSYGPTTTTAITTASRPAPAAVGDCVRIDNERFGGKGSCAASPFLPYKVTSTEYGGDSCPIARAPSIDASGYHLCLETHLVVNWCYNMPTVSNYRWSGWINVAAESPPGGKRCAPGMVGMVEILVGATDGSRCGQATDMQVTRWYRIEIPAQVACGYQW